MPHISRCWRCGRGGPSTTDFCGECAGRVAGGPDQRIWGPEIHKRHPAGSSGTDHTRVTAGTAAASTSDHNLHHAIRTGAGGFVPHQDKVGSSLRTAAQGSGGVPPSPPMLPARRERRQQVSPRKRRGTPPPPSLVPLFGTRAGRRGLRGESDPPPPPGLGRGSGHPAGSGQGVPPLPHTAIWDFRLICQTQRSASVNQKINSYRFPSFPQINL